MVVDRSELAEVLGSYVIRPHWVKHYYKVHQIGVIKPLKDERSRKSKYCSCEKKNRYRSEGEATACMHRCNVKRPGVYGIYYCEQCGGWHITHKPQHALHSYREVV